MKVISVAGCRIEAAYCNLRCPYCTHLDADAREMSPKEIAKKVSNCESVYIGGAEPTVHRDLEEVITKLSRKKITLKTSGFNPKAVEKIIEFVDTIVLEIKGDFDNLEKLSTLIGLNEERTKNYLERFFETLDIVRRSGKRIRIWARIIKDYLDANAIERVMKRIGRVDEILVYQYLSKPEWDKKVDYLIQPSYEEVIEAGKVAKKFADRVVVVLGGKKLEID